MPRKKSQKQIQEEADRKAEADRVKRQKMKLITLLREYPSIYDKGHPQHLNANTRDVIWENIATELGETGTVYFLIKQHLNDINIKLSA